MRIGTPVLGIGKEPEVERLCPQRVGNVRRTLPKWLGLGGPLNRIATQALGLSAR